jgi:uncharacterized membrane protein
MLARHMVRCALGTALTVAGISHLSWAREEFRAQVPGWLPLGADVVVLASGVVEIALGAALVLLPRHRVMTGWIAAAFFVAVLPGNINQLVHHIDAFGLNSDLARWLRLPFQPVLVVLALWSTEGWRRRHELLSP